jgi:hypothetical protein
MRYALVPAQAPVFMAFRRLAAQAWQRPDRIAARLAAGTDTCYIMQRSAASPNTSNKNPEQALEAGPEIL